MRIGKKTKTRGILTVMALALALVGCSSDSPMGPTSSTSGISPTATEVPSQITTPDLPTARIQDGNSAVTASARIGEWADSEVVDASADVQFVGVIGEVSVENSTIQFWNQDDNFSVVLGHVTEATQLLDENGAPVALEDFIICFSADVDGTEIAEGEIELTSVAMIAF